MRNLFSNFTETCAKAHEKPKKFEPFPSRIVFKFKICLQCLTVQRTAHPQKEVSDVLSCSFQPYERMNVADALIPRVYQDGDLIIHQVNSAWYLQVKWTVLSFKTFASTCLFSK